MRGGHSRSSGAVIENAVAMNSALTTNPVCGDRVDALTAPKPWPRAKGAG
jgi:hypothetical protein